jgi:hypothetical protein
VDIHKVQEDAIGFCWDAETELHRLLSSSRDGEREREREIASCCYFQGESDRCFERFLGDIRLQIQLHPDCCTVMGEV